MTGIPFTAVTWCQELEAAAAPRLTHYGQHLVFGENRVELSGPVMARWLAKTDNFLTEEFPFDGETFHLGLPRCWQRIVWETTCLLRGWESEEDAAEADLVVSDDVEVLKAAASSGQTSVAQTQHPLALQWPGELPAGVIDGTAALFGQADKILYPGQATPLWARQRDLLTDLTTVNGKGLTAVGGQPSLVGARVLVNTKDPTLLARQTLQLWAAGASVLVIDSTDREQVASIVSQENVDRVLD